MSNATPDTIAADNLATYIGDVNLTYGGKFIHVDESRRYATVIEYIDGSDIGCAPYERDEWDAKTLVEESTVALDCARLSQWRSALACIGLKPSAMRGMSRMQRAVELTYALHCYGFADIEESDELIDATDESLLADANARLCAL